MDLPVALKRPDLKPSLELTHIAMILNSTAKTNGSSSQQQHGDTGHQ